MRIFSGKKIRNRLYTGVVAALIVSACAGLGQRLESPRVKLANIAVREVKVLETVLEAELRVFNTNDATLEIKGVECELELNGAPFAVGVAHIDIQIPSYDTAILPLTIYASVIDLIKGMHGLPKNEQLTYLLKGKIRLSAKSFPAALPFTSQGSISLRNVVTSKEGSSGQ